MTDPIVEEVRAVRAQIAEQCGYDIERILEHARRTAAAIPGLQYITRDELKRTRPAPVNPIEAAQQP